MLRLNWEFLCLGIETLNLGHFIPATPIDAVRGVVGACRSCRKGIFDPSYLSIGGGNRGLTTGLFQNYRR